MADTRRVTLCAYATYISTNVLSQLEALGHIKRCLERNWLFKIEKIAGFSFVLYQSVVKFNVHCCEHFNALECVRILEKREIALLASGGFSSLNEE